MFLAWAKSVRNHGDASLPIRRKSACDAMSVSHPKSFGPRRSTVGRGQMLVITLLGLILCRFAGAQQIFSRRAVLLGVKRFAVPMNDVPMFACRFFHQPFKLLALVAATHVCHCAVLPFSRQSKKIRDSSNSVYSATSCAALAALLAAGYAIGA